MSDQDFFFDEDEKPAEKAKSSSPARSTAKSAAAAVPMTERSVSVTVAALIGVISLLLGVIIGLFVQPGTPATSPTATGGQVGAPAPQLTDEQIQGGLPEGHPPLPDMGGGTAPETAPEGDASGEATATN